MSVAQATCHRSQLSLQRGALVWRGTELGSTPSWWYDLVSHLPFSGSSCEWEEHTCPTGEGKEWDKVCSTPWDLCQLQTLPQVAEAEQRTILCTIYSLGGDSYKPVSLLVFIFCGGWDPVPCTCQASAF